jgi:hypothetical protein
MNVRGAGYMVVNYLARYRIQRLALVSKVMNLLDVSKGGNLLTR